MKAKNNIEIGAKINVNEVDGLNRVDFLRWEDYNEPLNLPNMVENYRDSFGYYPEFVVTGKIYIN